MPPLETSDSNSARESKPLELRIVGSRLQALALTTIAAALLLAKREDLMPWVLPVGLMLLALAATIAARLAILSPTSVSIRRITGTKQAQTGSFEAYADHRHLLLRFDDASRARIEVPVEIRPQVRDWAETNRRSGEHF